MSIEKGITCSYIPGIYAEGYIAFVFPFVRSFVRSFVTTFDLATLDSGERSLPFGLLVEKSLLDGLPVFRK